MGGSDEAGHQPSGDHATDDQQFREAEHEREVYNALPYAVHPFPIAEDVHLRSSFKRRAWGDMPIAGTGGLMPPSQQRWPRVA